VIFLLKADAVFEGGGVKGIGLVGALCSLEKRGYVWQRMAGTSAGSIVAALVAAGYTAKELEKILFDLDFNSFIDEKGLQSLPLVGKSLSFLISKGIYNGNKIEEWIRMYLQKKGKLLFKDVSTNGQSKLKIVAADITKKDLLILPDDLVKYGIDPMNFEIAKAVRMSISIPFFFKPIKFGYKNGMSYIVDGGVLSNFPIWIFDTSGKPRWPTFGFKLTEPKSLNNGLGKRDIVSFAFDIIDTMLDKNEEIYIKNKDFVRTISIPSSGIKPTQFDLSDKNRMELFNAGYSAGEKFIKEWSFDRYINQFRS
jgi:NTE family protein